VVGAAAFFPFTGAEQFFCSYPLKGPGDVFLFLGRNRELRTREKGEVTFFCFKLVKLVPLLS